MADYVTKRVIVQAVRYDGPENVLEVIETFPELDFTFTAKRYGTLSKNTFTIDAHSRNYIECHPGFWIVKPEAEHSGYELVADEDFDRRYQKCD